MLYLPQLTAPGRLEIKTGIFFAIAVPGGWQ